ncbi:MAG TPA: molybdopterin-dependent oxidoreductase, partial [Spirochaetales bacterium]|nr:molybdopterin-dependent oxidoreductase [Spirochaetales bacterium]
TSIRQIVAERLGFPLEKVKVSFECDTDKDPYDWQTVASKGLLLSGNAAILAAEDLLKNAYDTAARALRAQDCDLAHDGEKVFLKHNPAKAVRFAAMAVGLAMENGNGIGGPLVGVGRYIAQGLTFLDKETGEGSPALDWTYGAHGMTVEVNPETGEYRVLKIASVYDVGKAINPEIVRGQAIGGMLQGLGTATCEGYIYDKDGRLLNPSFTDNKIPTAKDLPLEVECYVVETPQVDGPYGARGVGEHSMISVAAALGNAIQKASGAEIVHMPIRFEDVWRALNEREPIDNWITKSPTGHCRSAPVARDR